MKHFLFPATLLILAISCNRKPACLESITLANVTDSLEVVPEALQAEDGVCATAYISLEIPRGGLRRKAIRNIRESIVTEALGEEYAGMKCAEATAAYLSAYADNYLRDAREISENSGNDNLLHTMNYYRSICGEVISLNRGILAYRISTEDYAGGAHGTYGDTWLNFKASDGTLLLPEELFTESGRETLDYLLKNELQAAGHTFWNYGSDSSAWLDGNFCMETDSIKFFYNPYEVDCYAAGIITVAMPLETIAPLVDEKKLKLNLENSD